MLLYNCEIDYFVKNYKNSRIICFGASRYASRMKIFELCNDLIKSIAYFVDNNPSTYGKTVNLKGREISIFPSDVLLNENNMIVVISVYSVKAVVEIINQLKEMGLDDSILVFSIYMMERETRYDNTGFLTPVSSDLKISKKIHCFWAGGKKPSNVEMCFDSWKKHCQDYEIVEWNEKNYNLESNKYIRQACAAKKWAFVSDYVRLDVIYRYGGIYMDFDVEVLKSLDDLLCFDAFMAFESTGLINIGSGMGAKAGHPLIKLLLDQYNDIEFLEKDEQFSSKTIIMQPIRQREVFERYGYQNNGKTQIINNVAFLSPDYINTVADPRHNKIYLRGNEYMVHWTHASWYDEYHQKEREDSNLYRDLLYEMDWRSV